MRHSHQHKPDSMAILILAVTIGLLLTTIVQADDYLFGHNASIVAESNTLSVKFVPGGALPESLLPDTKNSWLLPGGKGVRTLVKGGMAHFQLNSLDDESISQQLPSNTQVTLSLGLEEDMYVGQSNYRGNIDNLHWYDYYRPALYFSVGHRWK